MSVRDLALPLANAEAEAKWAREQAEAAAKGDTDALRRRTAGETLERSHLQEWFPDARFSVLEYRAAGQSEQYTSDGNDIIVESDDGVLFSLRVDRLTGDVEHKVVKERQATGYYAWEGRYYDGPVVDSVLEVGRALRAQLIAEYS